MATQVQFRRGNTTQTSTFTGAVAEITVDTDKKTAVVHDGVTAGGFALARESSLTANNQLSQSAFNHANSAFATANNEAGVNTTQNNSITAAFTAANSAGVYANSAFAAANAATATDATQNNSITAAFTAANSSGVYANGAFEAANSAGSYANSAFAIANSAASYSNTVNDTQNTSITASFTAANSAGVYANGAFAAANNEAGVNSTQNNSIIAAFTAANSSGVYANGAFTRANNSLNANTGGTISGDLVVTGNLIIQGNTITSNASVFVANDTLIILGAGNYTTDILDIGFAGHYNAGTNAHTGFIRDSVTKEWFLFKNYTPEIGANNNININDASFTIDTINANLKSTVITLNNQDLSAYVNNAFNTANAAFDSANAISGVNLTQNNSITAAFTAANSAGVYANAAFDKANAAGGGGVSSTGWTNNAIIYANSTGVLSNTSNLIYIASNNTVFLAGSQVATIGDSLALSIALG